MLYIGFSVRKQMKNRKYLFQNKKFAALVRSKKAMYLKYCRNRAQGMCECCNRKRAVESDIKSLNLGISVWNDTQKSKIKTQNITGIRF